MEENIRLELFTVADVREWLINGYSERGLSEQMIDTCRAWSIINNPYADESSYVISALFVNDEMAAYDIGFPDRVVFSPDYSDESKPIYWNSALYVVPQYEGRGYGAIVIGNLLEQYPDCFFDHAAAPASVENFKFLGLAVDYIPQYIFHRKTIHATGIKGKIAWLINAFEEKRRVNRKLQQLKSMNDKHYALQYVRFVDVETYSFIRKNAGIDCMLHSRETFNWMLQFPFAYQCPLPKRVCSRTVFPPERNSYQLIGVKVLENGLTIGFYILCIQGDEIIVKFLYYDEKYANVVFSSIIEHYLKSEKTRLVTYDSNLKDYILKLNIFARLSEYPTSFTHPQTYQWDNLLRFQAGEGDMFS